MELLQHSRDGRGYLHDNNFLYTKELAEWALARDARFVYASSAATYEDGSAAWTTKRRTLSATAPSTSTARPGQVRPSGPRRSLLPHIVGLKYFSVYGPNEEHKGDMRSVVSKSFAQIQDAGAMNLFRSHHPDYEDGKQLRDFHVKDAVRMTLYLAENDEANGLFNLGGQARSWLDLANAIFAALGKDAAHLH